ncbi:hypothetical protein BDV93DRAFT_566228 [Ceratobasidium sp. AG-I]|nr:hypothetical protein BDV93DRAFT_566228 [Ceratobasidium sp. AG-I]
MRPIPSRPVYPPAGIAPLIAGYQGLPHGGLTAPIERGDEMLQWKEMQRAKERADVVVKDGELTVAEHVEMEKRVYSFYYLSQPPDTSAIVSLLHVRNILEEVMTYGADDLPKARSPAQVTRRLPDKSTSRADADPSSSSDPCRRMSIVDGLQLRLLADSQTRVPLALTPTHLQAPIHAAMSIVDPRWEIRAWQTDA